MILHRPDSTLISASSVSHFILTHRDVPNRWSLYRTSDGGATWALTAKPDSIDERLIADATAVALSEDASTLYVGTAGCGVLHSNDGGETWDTFQRTNCDVRADPVPSATLPLPPEMLPKSMLHLMVSWSSAAVTKAKAGIQPSCHFRIVSVQLPSTASNRNVVYVVAGADGIWRSDDGAREWHKVSKGLEDRALADIAVGRSANEVYVVATNGDAWLSTDAGDHWQSLRRDLPAKSGTSIAITNEDAIVLATQGAGIYFLRRGSLLGQDAGDEPPLTPMK